MIDENKKEILSVLNDKKLLKELQITPNDIKKCIIMASKELKELEEIVKKSKEKKESFESLYKRLGGHNLWIEEEKTTINRFDLNYKSLLVTIQQGLDSNGNLDLSVQRSDIYIYPDNISKINGDYLLVLDFEKEIDFELINQYENNYKREIVKEDTSVVDFDKIESSKHEVQRLLKNVFAIYAKMKEFNIDRVDYKKSIYNNQELLNSKISNSDYSDLLGCMLDIKDEFEDIERNIKTMLNEIILFEEKYIILDENKQEESEIL